MANTFINRIIDVTASYVALSDSSEVCSVDISCPPGNANIVNFLGDDGVSDVPWVVSEYHNFNRVDLSKIKIKGTAPDTITIIGFSGDLR